MNSNQKRKTISTTFNTAEKELIDSCRTLLQTRYAEKQVYYAHVHTFGCQQNVNDGEKLKGMLALMGYGLTNTPQEADLVLFNTCAVREGAEERVFGNLGELKRLKQANPDMLIVLCGCMVQQETIVDRIKTSFPYVDLVFGTYLLAQFPKLLLEVLQKRKRLVNIDNTNHSITEGLPIQRDSSFKANLPVMYGCDNFCTYCIVPYVRGRERSRSSEEILHEANLLITQGYKEITLLGQNVNSYGKGLQEDIDFPALLQKLNDLPGDFWIRFMTSHPKDATKKLFDTMAGCEKVCKHLHLPVQCGSDRVLAAMNRRYTASDYLALVEYARKVMPTLSITSDLIVGFPTETYDDFLQTIKLIENIRFDNLFTFIYSKRMGTKAATMDDPISDTEKSLWFRELLDKQKTIVEGALQRFVGTTQRVLFDSPSKHRIGYLTGRNEQNIVVEAEAPLSLIGQFATVHITKALNWAIIGTLS